MISGCDQFDKHVVMTMAASLSQARERPNILITGTPGTGKSITATEVATKTNLQHYDCGEVARQNGMYEGWDEQYECHILDEDKLLDELEERMCVGGNILEYHGCDFFPERWFDAVFVLRTDNTILYDRLQKRGYSANKISQNVQCEIFQTILEEARESYNGSIVHELTSNLPEDLERNIDVICQFFTEFCQRYYA